MPRVAESNQVSSVWKEGIFDGQVAFVTGGAGSICSAQTRALVHLGANACIVGRSVEKTEAAAREIATVRKGATVIGVGGCDVRKIEDLEAAVERCVKELGGIDLVIAGAAGNFITPISSMSANAFKSVIDIDLLGSFNTVKATMPHLVRNSSSRKARRPVSTSTSGGRILFVSATFHYTGVPLQAHVSAAKAGVDALAASVALEYGPFGVQSNVIAPGPIAATEGMARLSGQRTETRVETSHAERSQEGGARSVPGGRWGTVRDIADATVFLFSEAGSHVNGVVMPVDGGAWRRQSAIGVGVDEGMEYPDFLFKGEISKHLKDDRKNKARL